MSQLPFLIVRIHLLTLQQKHPSQVVEKEEFYLKTPYKELLWYKNNIQAWITEFWGKKSSSKGGKGTVWRQSTYCFKKKKKKATPLDKKLDADKLSVL